ncbi:FHA domain-containing protein [Streptomyces sp. NPDC017260]|uniref:FHA domain-containing protein n=1 Tax=unclassified Streptomyces TaxID=2593676 RepID=UPI0037A60611
MTVPAPGFDEDEDDDARGPEDDGLEWVPTSGQPPRGSGSATLVASSTTTPRIVPCPHCGARFPAGTAACPACLSPQAGGRAPTGTARAPSRGTALRLVFRGAGSRLEVPPGGELSLGRDPDWAPEAAGLLAEESTVSSRHARVAHGEDGTASLTEVPQGSTNGVRINDRVLVAGRTEPLVDGDRVWLGPLVSFTVRVPGRPLC